MPWKVDRNCEDCLIWVNLFLLTQCCFLVYLMAPTSWNGSITIYYKFVRPLFMRHEKKIDSGIDKVADAGRAAFDEGES